MNGLCVFSESLSRAVRGPYIGDRSRTRDDVRGSSGAPPAPSPTSDSCRGTDDCARRCDDPCLPDSRRRHALTALQEPNMDFQKTRDTRPAASRSPLGRALRTALAAALTAVLLPAAISLASTG